MTKTSLITLQKGEEIYWQGKAHYPRPGIIEYIPAFVAALLLSNAYQQLCEAEPFIILHQFCSDSFVGGILLLFLLGGLAFPTMKRKLAARQTYIFTNQRAISLYTATGGILQTIPAEKLGNCIIKHHRGQRISIMEREHTGTETSETLLFAYIPEAVLKHYS